MDPMNPEVSRLFAAKDERRTYYAMFHAATAALLSQGIRRSKHSAVVAAFGRHLVKSGKFTAEQHGFFSSPLRIGAKRVTRVYFQHAKKWSFA